MRRIAALLAWGLACATAAAQPDYYLKEVVHADTYAWGSLRDSTFLHSNDLWLSPGRVTSIEKDRTVILDLSVDSLYILNPRTRTYVATSVPPALPDILGDDLRWIYARHGMSAAVRPRDATKTICGYPCRRYSVTTWIESDGSRSNERDMVVWACAGLPADCAAYTEMLRCMRMVYNRTPTGMAELATIDGVQMSIEMPDGGWFSGRSVVSEIVEITECTPPDTVHRVPDGYRRVPTLSRADLGL